MKSILFIPAFIPLQLQSNGQNKQIEDLKNQLASATEDTARVRILVELSARYTWSYADTARMYAEQALQLSKSIQFPRGITQGMQCLGRAYTIPI